MGINVGSCRNTAVPHPFLDSFDIDSIFIKYTGTAVPEIIKTKMLQAAFGSYKLKMACIVIWFDQIS